MFAGAYVDLKNNVSASPVSAATLKSDALFAKIAEEVQKNQAMAKSVAGVFLYNVTENGKISKKWSKFTEIILI